MRWGFSTAFLHGRSAGSVHSDYTDFARLGQGRRPWTGARRVGAAPGAATPWRKAQVAICGQPNISYTSMMTAPPDCLAQKWQGLAQPWSRKISRYGTLAGDGYMKKLVVLTILAVLAASAPGCQSGPSRLWRNGPVSTAAPPAYDGMAAMPPAAPSRGCGSGCRSCGGNSLPVLSGPQAFAAGPSTGPVLGQ